MTKKEINVSLKTMAIKARVYNQIRIDLFRKHLEKTVITDYNKEEVLTNERKIELFNKWFTLNKDAHYELNAYKLKRQYKAKIEKLRQEKKDLAEQK